MPLDCVIGPIRDPSLAKELSDFFLSQAPELSQYYTRKDISQHYQATLTTKAIEEQISGTYRHSDGLIVRTYFFANYTDHTIDGALRTNIRKKPGTSHAFINPIMVSNKGQGIGSSLLRSMEKYIGENENLNGFAANVHEDNKDSRRLFRRRGYEVISELASRGLFYYKSAS